MPRPPIIERPLVFVDTETTGLDENKHEIIDIAIVGEDGATIFNTNVKPRHIETADPKALEINGYNAGEWEPSPYFTDIAERVLDLLSGPVIVGQNVQFDMRFINRELRTALVANGLSEEETAKKMRKVSYHMIDTVTLIYEHLGPCGITSLSLKPTADFLGIELDNAHTALADARATREVFYKLLRATWWQRLKWKWRARRGGLA